MHWQIILGLSGIAVIFILWPLLSHWWRREEDEQAQARILANTRLYEEHLVELQQLLNNGDISQEDFTALKLEQQHALLEDAAPKRTPYRRDGVMLLVAFAVLVPVLGWVMYEQLGASDDWQIHQAIMAWRSGEKQGAAFETQLRHDLARRLQERPENVQNWHLLAALAMDVQDYDQAVEALRRIATLQPGSAQIKAELAEALFLQAGNKVTPEVRRNTRQALEIAPNTPTALGLAGIDAFQQGYFQKAIDYWSRAVKLLGEEARGAQTLRSGIARAQAELEARGKVVTEPESSAIPALVVSVKLSEAVSVAPSDTVFVYARAFEGPRMPLAIRRFPASELPKTVRLDDSTAMAPGMTLSRFEQLEVVARVSRSGNAVPQSGDWQAVQGPVALPEEVAEISLIINKQIP